MTCPYCEKPLERAKDAHRCKCGFEIWSGDEAKVREVLRELRR